MLPQADLDALADGTLAAFNALEGRLRGAAAAEVTKLASADAQALRTRLAMLSRGDKRGIDRAVREAFVSAARTSTANDELAYSAARAAGIIAPYAAISESAALDEILRKGVASAQSLANLVRTSATNAVYADFIDALDSAMVATVTSVASPDAAIRHAVKKIATRTTTVTYLEADGTVLEQGLYSSVRRAVITGANQTTGRLTDARAAEIGAVMFEVSAHLGARPEHAEWQGGIYTMEQLIDVCGYGDGAGLEGWNCRHTHYPVFPEIMEPTDWGWAEDPDGEEYELSQRQRTCERNIRGYKAREQSYSGVVGEAAGDKELKAWAASERDSAAALKKKWQQEADTVAAKRGGGGARRPAREVGRHSRAK